MAPPSDEAAPKQTPLHELHRQLGGKIVTFAGWSLPVQYDGIMAEHRHCRAAAALFDVSHMGQLQLHGADAPAALETLVPADLQQLEVGRARYTLLTNEQGGVRDDLIVSRVAGGLFVVVNAACAEADIALLRTALEPRCRVEVLSERALLALQGPQAAAVLARLTPAAETLGFMQTTEAAIDEVPCRISRLGYTGEDGFEISLAKEQAAWLARRLLDQPEVAPAGLGARDSLRLEAGLCLYGHDLTADTTPIEAGLAWTIGKRRRERGGFPGAAVIQELLRDGPARRLVGLRPEGRAPAREGTEIQARDGSVIGRVTSGGFGPTVGAPIAMGYVASSHAAPGSRIALMIRGQSHAAHVVALPFVPHRYHQS